jgi:hypothetical protein
MSENRDRCGASMARCGHSGPPTLPVGGDGNQYISRSDSQLAHKEPWGNGIDTSELAWANDGTTLGHV